MVIQYLLLGVGSAVVSNLRRAVLDAIFQCPLNIPALATHSGNVHFFLNSNLIFRVHSPSYAVNTEGELSEAFVVL